MNGAERGEKGEVVCVHTMKNCLEQTMHSPCYEMFGGKTLAGVSGFMKWQQFSFLSGQEKQVLEQELPRPSMSNLAHQQSAPRHLEGNLTKQS